MLLNLKTSFVPEPQGPTGSDFHMFTISHTYKINVKTTTNGTKEHESENEAATQCERRGWSVARTPRTREGGGEGRTPETKPRGYGKDDNVSPALRTVLGTRKVLRHRGTRPRADLVE